MDEIGKFGEAASKLTEILKDAAGIIIEPAKKYTNSQVEMYIEKKRIKHSIELEKIEIAERAKLRIFEIEIRRQHNLESIGSEAIKGLPEGAKPDDINIDWLHHFADCCKDVGDEELRSIWATILKKEATKSGQFSKRTINALKDFTIEDCQTFNKLSKYISHIDEHIYFIINPTKSKDYNLLENSDINYRELLHMSHLNLLSNTDNAGFKIHPNDSQLLTIQNHEIILNNETEKDIWEIYYLVTDIGMELMKITELNTEEVYINKLKEHFSINKLTVTAKIV